MQRRARPLVLTERSMVRLCSLPAEFIALLSAENIFHKLSKAQEVLIDKAARAALDNVRKAREQARVRHSQLGAKRKKFKEELEAREAAAAGRTVEDAEGEAQRRLEREVCTFHLRQTECLSSPQIARLRKEGSELLQREREK